MASSQHTPALFRPIKLGRITLQHRVVLAPLTRFRAYADHVPGPRQASYYSQRASTPGNLLITETTFISHDAGGYEHVPGIYTDGQIQGWKKITEAVHAKGSFIFPQLWALGRRAEPEVLEKDVPPSPFVAPSPIALTEDEIDGYISAYAKAASNAVHQAGFDGVEIHGANGFLIEQFIHPISNTRTDGWGGDEQGRTRFAREVVDAVVDAVGPERVGLRISPWNTSLDMGMSNPRPTYAYLATALRERHPKLAYLHAVEPRIREPTESPAPINGDNDFLRDIWNGGEGGEDRLFISAGGYTRDTALRTAEEKAGLITFGRQYISNPDLPARLQRNLPLTPPDRRKFYLPGNLTPFGYNDWPFVDGSIREVEGVY